MSTITKEFTKEQLIEKLQHRISVASGFPESEKAQMDLELARIALASLEAKPVSVNDDMAYAFHHAISDSSLGSDEVEEIKTGLRAAFANVTAPPAPVSVPAAMEMDDDFDSSFEHGKAVGWNAYRAAMLQGADRPQNEPENIPATQFKPVADLYGLTSPTGGETSFTFDAVEARDFIDGGWSCQEYVELERFQEAITNHTEDKLAMVDHSGDSNNMVEPVTTACKLLDDFDFDRFNDVVWLEAVESNPHMHSLTTSTIAMVALELNRKLADRNSTVIQDGWVACSERLPPEGYEPDGGAVCYLVWHKNEVDCGPLYSISNVFFLRKHWEKNFTHWMPLPAAPQQE
ncbi:DUF551 domain-containing protein [Enterobacter hormaechei]|uniref:DUF551 domain-containing protein n=1 Tax=Enterobacter hormaechei TaxID=158836 RepID=UPI00190D141F|nr:DUF551 domain-containing protein [Enterobacter hormaechei]MBK2957175.1 DUF551 domain-containing protein [Enterobacter hormaechei]